MLKHLVSIFVFSALCLSNAQAQILPQNLETLVTIDQTKLRNKLLVPKATTYPFFELLMSSYQRELEGKYRFVEQLYQNPRAAGLDTSTYIYLFMDKVEEHLHTGVHFYISDISTFEMVLDSITQRDRPRIGIPDNAPDALREALLKEQAKQDRYWAQFRPQIIPNTNFKRLTLPKATYVWTSNRAYIFQTRGLNEWNGVDEDDENISRKLFQEYKKARGEAKQNYIQKLSQLHSQGDFQKELVINSDIVAWVSDATAMEAVPGQKKDKRPQLSPLQLLTGDILQLIDTEQVFKLNFEKTAIFLSQEHKTRGTIPSTNRGSLSLHFLQENNLLSIESREAKQATEWMDRMYSYLKTAAFYPVTAIETRILHGYQKYTVDHVHRTKRGTDTIATEVVRPNFTSFLAIEDVAEQLALIEHLLKEKLIRPTENPKLYRSMDTTYTAYIVPHAKGLFWSMNPEITQTEYQLKVLGWANECPSAYKLVDMRTSVEELSLMMPSLYTAFYRSVKNNWRSTTQNRKSQKGAHTNALKFGGFPKAATETTSVDMLLEIVNSFFNQVQQGAKERG